jgi:HAMP domain-containing protein
VKTYQSRRASRARLPFNPIIGMTLALLIQTPFASFAAVPRSAFAAQETSRLAQNDDQGDDAEVPTAQVEKYVAVYKAMQRNRNLTIEKAAASQGMTVRQFRELENRVQRDDAALQHARDELQAAAARAPASSGSAEHSPVH